MTNRLKIFFGVFFLTSCGGDGKGGHTGIIDKVVSANENLTRVSSVNQISDQVLPPSLQKDTEEILSTEDGGNAASGEDDGAADNSNAPAEDIGKAPVIKAPAEDIASTEDGGADASGEDNGGADNGVANNDNTPAEDVASTKDAGNAASGVDDGIANTDKAPVIRVSADAVGDDAASGEDDGGADNGVANNDNTPAEDIASTKDAGNAASGVDDGIANTDKAPVIRVSAEAVGDDAASGEDDGAADGGADNGAPSQDGGGKAPAEDVGKAPVIKAPAEDIASTEDSGDGASGEGDGGADNGKTPAEDVGKAPVIKAPAEDIASTEDSGADASGEDNGIADNGKAPAEDVASTENSGGNTPAEDGASTENSGGNTPAEDVASTEDGGDGASGEDDGSADNGVANNDNTPAEDVASTEDGGDRASGEDDGSADNSAPAEDVASKKDAGNAASGVDDGGANTDKAPVATKPENSGGVVDGKEVYVERVMPKIIVAPPVEPKSPATSQTSTANTPGTTATKSPGTTAANTPGTTPAAPPSSPPSAQAATVGTPWRSWRLPSPEVVAASVPRRPGRLPVNQLGPLPTAATQLAPGTDDIPQGGFSLFGAQVKSYRFGMSGKNVRVAVFGSKFTLLLAAASNLYNQALAFNPQSGLTGARAIFDTNIFDRRAGDGFIKSSTIAMKQTPSRLGFGVAPQAEIIPIRIINQKPYQDAIANLAGIHHAIKNGAKIILPLSAQNVMLTLVKKRLKQVDLERYSKLEAYRGISLEQLRGQLERTLPIKYKAGDPVGILDGDTRQANTLYYDRGKFDNYEQSADGSITAMRFLRGDNIPKDVWFKSANGSREAWKNIFTSINNPDIVAMKLAKTYNVALVYGLGTTNRLIGSGYEVLYANLFETTVRPNTIFVTPAESPGSSCSSVPNCIAAPSWYYAGTTVNFRSPQDIGPADDGNNIPQAYVAGVLALVAQAYPNMSMAEIIAAVLSTAHKGTARLNGATYNFADSDRYGAGLVDIIRVLEANSRTMNILLGATMTTHHSFPAQQSNFFLSSSFGHAVRRGLENEKIMLADDYGRYSDFALTNFISLTSQRDISDFYASFSESFFHYHKEHKKGYLRADYAQDGPDPMTPPPVTENTPSPKNGWRLSSAAFHQEFSGTSLWMGYNADPAFGLGLHTTPQKNMKVLDTLSMSAALRNPFMGQVNLQESYSAVMSLHTRDSMPAGIASVNLAFFKKEANMDEYLPASHGYAIEMSPRTGKSFRMYLQAGQHFEEQGFLGSYGDGAFDTSHATTLTNFTGVKLSYQAAKSWLVLASYYKGFTKLPASSHTLSIQADSVTSDSWSVALMKEKVFVKNDHMTMAVHQPLRLSSGEGKMRYPFKRDWQGNIYYTDAEFSLEPEGRELDLEFSYSRLVGQETEIKTSMLYRYQPEHLSTMSTQAIFMVGMSHRF